MRRSWSTSGPPTDPPVRVLEPGTVVAGRYRLDEPLVQGSMGTLWKATHLGLDRQVAVKFVTLAHGDAAAARRRFAIEARAAAKLRSRYVVRVYDHGQLDDGTPYIAMELLQGETLGQRISRAGPLGLSEAVRFACHVGRALAHAHDAGILHRDLKPENVFLEQPVDDPGEIAKVVDFGVAKMSDSNLGATAAGTLLGSPHFMSPEQARGRSDVDARADIFSLGATVFTMLTADTIVHGDGTSELLLQLCDDDFAPPRLTAVRPDLPAALDDWLARVCAADRERRPPDVRSAVQELQEAAGVRVEQTETFTAIRVDAAQLRRLRSDPAASGGVQVPMTPIREEDLPLALAETAPPAAPVRASAQLVPTPRGAFLGISRRELALWAAVVVGLGVALGLVLGLAR